MANKLYMDESPFLRNVLHGRVALVTGGGSGIGFEIARQLLFHGCVGVVICGRRPHFLERACRILARDTAASAGEKPSEGNWHSKKNVSDYKIVNNMADGSGGHGRGKVSYFVCDVRNPSDCEAAVAHCLQIFERLDILVNGAAGNFLAAANQLSPKGFATVMAIDTMGTFNMSHAAYKALKNGRKGINEDNGIIINISATLQQPATHWQSHASAAKAGVDSLTRSLALEWGADGIRVVGIAPGPIANTPGTTKLAPGMTQEDTKNLIIEGIPLARMGEAWEIGHAVIYLCTAKYVTGDVLIVDGGQWLYKPPMVPREMVAHLSRQVEAKSRAQAPRSKL